MIGTAGDPTTWRPSRTRHHGRVVRDGPPRERRRPDPGRQRHPRGTGTPSRTAGSSSPRRASSARTGSTGGRQHRPDLVLRAGHPALLRRPGTVPRPVDGALGRAGILEGELAPARRLAHQGRQPARAGARPRAEPVHPARGPAPDVRRGPWATNTGATSSTRARARSGRATPSTPTRGRRLQAHLRRGRREGLPLLHRRERQRHRDRSRPGPVPAPRQDLHREHAWGCAAATRAMAAAASPMRQSSRASDRWPTDAHAFDPGPPARGHAGRGGGDLRHRLGRVRYGDPSSDALEQDVLHPAVGRDLCPTGRIVLRLLGLSSTRPATKGHPIKVARWRTSRTSPRTSRLQTRPQDYAHLRRRRASSRTRRYVALFLVVTSRLRPGGEPAGRGGGDLQTLDRDQSDALVAGLGPAAGEGGEALAVGAQAATDDWPPRQAIRCQTSYCRSAAACNRARRALGLRGVQPVARACRLLWRVPLRGAGLRGAAASPASQTDEPAPEMSAVST